MMPKAVKRTLADGLSGVGVIIRGLWSCPTGFGCFDTFGNWQRVELTSIYYLLDIIYYLLARVSLLLPKKVFRLLPFSV
jgi:hypothetical protein